MTVARPLPVVIGTAGHIDHGKSALIQALTGTHPDRWREEQERGITLDLGYAQFEFEDGLELGFVDVPGHERLVRKMVAGATGMGAAMLVVACDDGVMPQTREHFEVLGMLGVDHGLVALSKTDLADEEVLALVRADVEALLAGSTWEGCPQIPVSAHTGKGVAELRQALRELAERAQRPVDPLHAFRLPVQRAFALHGAGTVVTGIAASGSVHEGDTVEVWPGGVRSRVRRVQVHGRAAEAGLQGLRVALNLPDAGPSDCPRGAVVAEPGRLRSGRLLRACVRALPGAPAWDHGGPVQVLAGTAAVQGRIFLPRERGEPWVVDLELAEPMALVPGERLLLRRPSPAENQGAGRFLAFGRRRLRTRDVGEREALQRLAAVLDEPARLAARSLELEGGRPRDAGELAGSLGWTVAAALAALEEAGALGEVRRVGADRYVGAGRAGALAKEVTAIVTEYRAQAPHRLRIPVERFRKGLGKGKAQTLEKLAAPDLAALGLRRRPGLEWELVDAAPPDEVRELGGALLAILVRTALVPPDFESLAAELAVSPGRVGVAAEYLCDAGEAVRLASGQVFGRAAVEALRSAVVEQLQGGGMDIPALRDRFGTTRRFLMPLLEYLDERGVTTRRGPNRILRDPKAALA